MYIYIYTCLFPITCWPAIPCNWRVKLGTVCKVGTVSFKDGSVELHAVGNNLACAVEVIPGDYW